MTSESAEKQLSHVGPCGEARMVDVSPKPVTVRDAVASAVLTIRKDVLDRLLIGDLPKGDALATARIAGITVAKRTSEWIPLCHTLPLEWVEVVFRRDGDETLLVTCSARVTARTGVEMEALTGAAAAALTVYDMVKAVDRGVVIGPIQLESKTGGASGPYHREAGSGGRKPSDASGG